MRMKVPTISGTSTSAPNTTATTRSILLFERRAEADSRVSSALFQDGNPYMLDYESEKRGYEV
jgi:hypothetical protein